MQQFRIIENGSECIVFITVSHSNGSFSVIRNFMRFVIEYTQMNQILMIFMDGITKKRKTGGMQRNEQKKKQFNSPAANLMSDFIKTILPFHLHSLFFALLITQKHKCKGDELVGIKKSPLCLSHTFMTKTINRKRNQMWHTMHESRHNIVNTEQNTVVHALEILQIKIHANWWRKNCNVKREAWIQTEETAKRYDSDIMKWDGFIIQWIENFRFFVFSGIFVTLKSLLAI